MQRIMVTVRLPGEAQGRDLELPAELAAGRLAAEIVSGLAGRGARVQTGIAYAIEALPPGRQLAPAETLADAGVWDGATLLLRPAREASEAEKARQAVLAREEAELARQFDAALLACRRHDWARGRALLAEIVRRRPDYVRNGRSARDGLLQAEKRLAARPGAVLDWQFWLAWFPANVAGLVIGAGLGALLCLLLVEPLPVDWRSGQALAAALLGGCAGTGLGALQWLVLRRHLRLGRGWAPANGLGWLLGAGAVAWLCRGVYSLPAMLALGAAAGALGGLGQWLGLRHVRRADRWPLTAMLSTALAWALAWGLSMQVQAIDESGGYLLIVLGWGIGGLLGSLLSAAISGAVLAWLI